MAVVKSSVSSPSIDTHFHVFSASADAVPGARYRPAYAATFTQWQALAEPCGVRAGVLVQPSFLGADNSALLGVLARAPHMRAVVQLLPGTPADVITSLHAAGVRGVRWNMAGRLDDASWSHPHWPALLAQVASLGWHLEVHSDVGGLPAALHRLPDLGSTAISLVLDHFGKPDPARGPACDTFAAAMALADRHPVYVKCSAAYRLQGQDPVALLSRWASLLGTDRLLWGSDWPCTNFEQVADYPALHALPAAWAEALGREIPFDANARKVFYDGADALLA